MNETTTTAAPEWIADKSSAILAAVALKWLISKDAASGSARDRSFTRYVAACEIAELALDIPHGNLAEFFDYQAPFSLTGEVTHTDLAMRARVAMGL